MHFEAIQLCAPLCRPSPSAPSLPRRHAFSVQACAYGRQRTSISSHRGKRPLSRASKRDSRYCVDGFQDHSEPNSYLPERASPGYRGVKSTTPVGAMGKTLRGERSIPSRIRRAMPRRCAALGVITSPWRALASATRPPCRASWAGRACTRFAALAGGPGPGARPP